MNEGTDERVAQYYSLYSWPLWTIVKQMVLFDGRFLLYLIEITIYVFQKSLTYGPMDGHDVVKMCKLAS